VTRVLAAVAAGLSFEQVEQEYGVTAEDIRAAIAFANGLVALLPGRLAIVEPHKIRLRPPPE